MTKWSVRSSRQHLYTAADAQWQHLRCSIQETKFRCFSFSMCPPVKNLRCHSIMTEEARINQTHLYKYCALQKSSTPLESHHFLNYKELKKILSVIPQMSEKQHWPSKTGTLVTLVNLLKSHGSQFIIHIRYHVHVPCFRISLLCFLVNN